MATDQRNKPRPWTDAESRLVRGSFDEYVSRAATAVGRTDFAVQCRIMLLLGVSQKEIDRIVKSRKRRSPLGRAFDKLWDFTNHQVVGGVLLFLVLALGATLYGVVNH